jgi:hypothetical protein
MSYSSAVTMQLVLCCCKSYPHKYLPLLLVLLLLAVLLASGAATQLETDLTIVLL